MRLVAFEDEHGDMVMVNIDMIRTMDGDTDNKGPLTEIFFDAAHSQRVRGDLSRVYAMVMDAVGVHL